MRGKAFIVAMAAVPGGAWMSTADADIPVPGGALHAALIGTSNYISRGISNSDDHPALQALAEYRHHSGLYLGTFASNVDFDDDNNATVETDIWAGYTTKLGGVTLRADALGYLYPGVGRGMSEKFNTLEFESSAAATISGVFVIAGIAYSPNYFFNSGDSFYYELDVRVPVYGPLALEGHIGHQDVQRNRVFGMPDYNDWLFGASVTYRGVKAGLYYVDTDVSRDRCFAGKDWCAARALAEISYRF